MIAVDTNILVYAHREDADWHDRAASAVARLAKSPREWAIPWPCLHEFLAIVTHPRIFRTPTPVDLAMSQVEAWLESPTVVILSENDQYLASFREVVLSSGDGQTDVWGVQLPANWTSGFEYWVAAAGGRLICQDGTSYVDYMDYPETIQAVQFFADLYNKYKVAPPPADFNLWSAVNPQFESGKAAMRLFGRWPQTGLLSNPNVDLGTVEVPACPNKANVLFWGGFGIFSGSKNPEAAWRFLKFYVGAEGWKSGHNMPSRLLLLQQKRLE